MTAKLPTMHEVKSANISKMGAHQGTLYVQFSGGGVYKYPGAGHHLAEAMKAESVGKWFHANIKGRYNHALVDD